MPRYHAHRTIYAGGRARAPGSTVDLTEADAAALPAGSVSRIDEPAPSGSAATAEAASGKAGGGRGKRGGAQSGAPGGSGNAEG